MCRDRSREMKIFPVGIKDIHLKAWKEINVYGLKWDILEGTFIRRDLKDIFEEMWRYGWKCPVCRVH